MRPRRVCSLRGEDGSLSRASAGVSARQRRTAQRSARSVTLPPRLQLSRRAGWRLPAGAVVVARPRAWGNPWRVGRDGSAQHCCDEFRRCLLGEPVTAWPLDPVDIQRAIALSRRMADLQQLRGRPLACWCAPDAPCHADILIKLANAPSPMQPARTRSDQKRGAVGNPDSLIQAARRSASSKSAS
ncbi:DUF4326 domain-containing protein [Dokdonella sp. MW10]|uniref:DUF4326 domain-containing protein n=1 Tax=Dokdonella sp. MW10 TaxID=2992926 RepID=UPI003F818024